MRKSLLNSFLAFLTIFIVACSGSTNSPEGITKYFIENTYKGNIEALVEAIDLGKDDNVPQAKQVLTGKMSVMVIQAKELADANGGISKIEIKNVNYLNDEKSRATVSFTVHFKKNDMKDNGELKTIQTDKGWKIAF